VARKLNMHQFVASHGALCPACASDDHDSLDINVCEQYVLRECNCLDCGAQWTSVYKLVYHENLKVD
jgi:Zn ribbon nucleic-acid-binding protein